ncbi:MAG: DUF4340 domain-containing protein [Reichenbachiella sp.]|uniref:DUF4340 domain-containing protein n=1 Tax=Reichenbachiella sp. TaxID=2184521 RepID=UPI00326306A1
MNRVKKLSVIFVGLLIVSLALHWIGNREKSSKVNKELFAVADTTQIENITIITEASTISINREVPFWTLNGQYKVDPQLVYLSQRILSHVEVQRHVSKSNFEDIKNELKNSGSQVTINLKDGSEKQFYTGGNTAKTTAYFANDDLTEIYIVTIPGYKSYLSGIFELSLNQWRDRVLFSSSWRTIQQLKIDYTSAKNQDLEIVFDGNFLAVKQVSQLDTAKLIEYLEPFEQFQVNDYLDQGNFPRYDSLLGVEPLAILALKDIDTKKDQVLTIFPKIEGERFYLLTNKSSEMLVVDERRMERLLFDPSQFIRD